MLPADVRNCVSALEGAGYAAYLVGGCVRDLLLGRTPMDYDVATSALPQQVQALFRRTVPTGIQHGTVTVLMGDSAVEVTTFRHEGGYADGRRPERVTFDVGLEEDLARRDFTINAMAMDLGRDVTDPFGGRGDLAGHLVRCVGNPDKRFAEDALRMLRGVRFCAQLGFELEGETRHAIGRNAWRTAQLSGARIKAEMEKILLSPAPERAAALLSLGLLNHLYTQTGADLSPLREMVAEPIPRWRGFCKMTGFPIDALPVERALRRGVQYPEGEALRALKLSGGDLMALGLQGVEIGVMQRRLAAHILEHPADNVRGVLLCLAQGVAGEKTH